MNKLLKLAKALLKFEEIKTDNGVLTINEDLAVGIEVFIEDENGDFQPAADGEYVAEDGRKIQVSEGKISEIIEAEEKKEEVAAEEEKKEENEEKKEEEKKEEVKAEETAEPDEKDLKIQELEGLLKDRDAVIEELNAKIKELEEKVGKPVEEEVKMKAQVAAALSKTYENPALKYFEQN